VAPTNGSCGAECELCSVLLTPLLVGRGGLCCNLAAASKVADDTDTCVGGPVSDTPKPQVEEVLKRARSICPTVTPHAQSAAGGSSVQRSVRMLVESALSPRNLCRMDATWLASL
jgi:hypothetical protein